MTRKLYIIDGHAQIYRAYYARFRDLTSPTGEPTRATYVFCTMLLKFLADKKPDYVAMAIDAPTEGLLRRRLYQDYKTTRKPAPADFQAQAQRIVQIVREMGIAVLGADGYEADDIMATAAETLACDDLDVILVSRDKDLEQLVCEHVSLYDPTDDVTLDVEAIEQTKGYPPAKAVEIQTLTGDSTDNIPGVVGVGPKTAARLIARYGTAEAAVAHADEQTPKLRDNLLAGTETIKLSRQLVTLDRAVPIELDLDAMKFTGISGTKLQPIFAELGFNRLIDQLADLGFSDEARLDLPAIAGRRGRTTADDFEYTCIDTPEALKALVKEISDASITRLAVDTETDSARPMWASLVGISLSWRAGEAVYLPIRGPLGAATLDIELVRATIGAILADERIEKIGQNLKYDILVLAGAGIELAGDVFDTMVAAHVLDSSRLTYKLDALAADLLNHHCIPIEEVIGRGRNQITMDVAPVDVVAKYAAEDADVTFRLAEVLEKQLVRENLDGLMRDLEMPLLGVLAAMERRGVIVNPAALKDMAAKMSAETDRLRARIIELAGREFNPDSPKQLGEVLFGDLGLPIIKQKTTAPSTDSSVLRQLAVQHELPAVVLDYRKLTKLLSTYLKALGAQIHPRTGRVHTSFNQAGTTTGRLSSRDPNLQNIPIRTALGRQIRSAFVPAEGCLMLSADYSQVELRVLAHLSEDPTLIDAFQHDQDIHRIVAAEVFSVAPDDVTSDQRAAAKTVNFGIIYGQTAFGLSVSLRIPRSEAADFIKRYRSRFPNIDTFLETCVRAAKDQGYVETIFGRRRRITEIDSRNPQRRAQAERLAINSVVQGSAADLIKRAMINIDKRIRQENGAARMLLQIHDELLFEIPYADLDSQREMIVAEMEGAVELRVPVKVDVAVGENWMDAK
ncbi:MAG: DNA polymerase I [Planctomycetes bacterium]|nr:DNA polymerase I [Planctomycetota bacterium]